MLAAAANGGQMLAMLLGQDGVAVKELGEAEDGVHRRADLVGHVGEEGALGAIGAFGGVLGFAQFVAGFFEVGGAFADEFLEAVAVAFQFLLGFFAGGDVLGDGDQAFFAADGDAVRGDKADNTIAGAQFGGDLPTADGAGGLEVADLGGAIGLVGPDAEVNRGLADEVSAGGFVHDGESLVGLDNGAVGQAGDEHADGAGLKGLGKFSWDSRNSCSDFLRAVMSRKVQMRP